MSRPRDRRMRVLATALVLCAAVAGCRGGSAAAPVAAASAAPTVDPARGLTEAQARAALLSVGDLPLGFQAQDGAGDAAALGCAGIDGVYLPGGAAARAAVSFAHSLSPAYVNETITTRPGGAAAAALAAFGRSARDCASFAGPDGTAYRVAAVTVPRWGDGSAAVRVTSGLREARPVELVAVRLGDTVVAVAAAGSGAADAALTRTVVDRALAKIARNR